MRLGVRRPVLLATALLLAGMSLAPACNYHGGAFGVFDGNFRALYPKSSEVYFAIVDAVEEGLIERAAFEPSESGYLDAARRLEEIARRLPAVDGAPSLSLVFIESDLWARYAPGPGGYSVAVHTPGPRAGDVSVVTSEPGLAAVLGGRILPSVAFERGLIALDGEEGARQAVQRLLLAALDPAAHVSASGPRAPPRLFGPPR